MNKRYFDETYKKYFGNFKFNLYDNLDNVIRKIIVYKTLEQRELEKKSRRRLILPPYALCYDSWTKSNIHAQIEPYITNCGELAAAYGSEKDQKINQLTRVPRRIKDKILRCENKSLNAQEIRIFLGILSEVNGNGEIPDFNKARLFDILERKFGTGNISVSTFYYVMDRLDIVYGFISFKNDKNGCLKLVVNDYKDTFRKGSKGTFTLPEFVFAPEFNELTVTAIRLCLDILSRLNVYHYRHIGYRCDEVLLKLLKRRCPEEVNTAMRELEQFFDIVYYTETTYNIALKEEYLIKNEAELKGVKYPEQIRYKKTWDKIQLLLIEKNIVELLKKRNEKYKDNKRFEDTNLTSAIATLTKLLNRYPKYINVILDKLKDKLKNWSDPIFSIGGFIQTMIDTYVLCKSYAELSIKNIENQIKRLEEYGFTLDDFPSLKTQYNYLLSQ